MHTIVLILISLLIIWVFVSYKQTVLLRKVEGNTVPYLLRYTLLSCKFFTIKIHKVLLSDPVDLHDHPWNYLSIILWGGYYEETRKSLTITDWDGSPVYISNTSKKFYKPGSILYRTGDKPHRLILDKDKYSISLIITFRKWRDWGFLKDNRWVSHKRCSY